MFFSLDVYQKSGPKVQSHACNQQDNEKWIWNATEGTIRSVFSGRCLMTLPDLETWAGPLQGGSQAVVLLNRGDFDSANISVYWDDIDLPLGEPATVRDLWARKDLGVFHGSYTSPKIDSHSVMMLNITLVKPTHTHK